MRRQELKKDFSWFLSDEFQGLRQTKIEGDADTEDKSPEIENDSLFFHLLTIHFFLAYFSGVYDIANVTFAFNDPVDVVAV